jgi:ABC-type dipeptide/oligopeptide/nickel transport system ATPase subunit
MLSELKMRTYEAILEEELLLAMGCTEPIAIAYAAAILKTALGGEPTEVLAGLSGNIIKNVKSVIVPMTGGKHGIPTAVAAGIISGRADLKLEVLSALSDGSGEKIEEYLRNNTVKIEELNTPCTFELHLDGRLKSHRATVRITATHTNVTEVTLDGKDITYKFADEGKNDAQTECADRSLLTVEEIVEFAELKDYMHIPLKNYSSGMVARLGFAIAIDVQPDILLVDEILSVGDENFRKKCAQKVNELRERGVTFVIVSHNMPQVKSLCQKAIWIENSEVMAYGDVNEVCEKYQEYCKEQKK